jgi:probable AcnD-accessory protein PrpF
MGAATSSTSKCVIVSPATRAGHDVDYLYGQIAIDSGALDWSSNCGNLSTAVGAFAIAAGYVDAARAVDGLCTVRIWQANIGKTIVAHVPVADGQVIETGDFELDGVAFPAAEIVLEFVDPADASDALFPTGHLVDTLKVDDDVVPGGVILATLINAGVPTVFVAAEDLGYTGAELRDAINGDADALARFEALRTAGAEVMGITKTTRAPAIAFVAAPIDHQTSSGREVVADEVDLLVRALSMGKLHHAMMGTASVAIAAAAAVPGTLVNKAAGGGERTSIRFGHPSGSLGVGAEAHQANGQWIITRAVMSRSARVLMDGHVHVPADSF